MASHETLRVGEKSAIFHTNTTTESNVGLEFCMADPANLKKRAVAVNATA